MKIHFFLFLFFITSVFAGASGIQEGKILTKWNYNQGISKVVVFADRQDVQIRYQDSGVSGRLLGDDTDDWTVHEDQGTLVIKVETRKTPFTGQPRSGTVELLTPRGLTIEITSASGNVTVESPVDSLKVQTASGCIIAKSGGRFADLSSASGSIQARFFTEGAKIQSYSGSVSAEDFRGSLEVSTLSGEMAVQNLKGDLSAQSSAGQVKICRLEGSLRYTNVSGNLEAQAVLLAGDSRLRTTSGSIHMKLSGNRETFTIRAKSVSGEVILGKEKARTLEKGSGPVVIDLETVSGSIETEW